jgi:hypothetical protein
MFAELSWSRATAGSLTVLHELPLSLSVIDPPLRATRLCADLTLSDSSYDASEFVAATAGAKRADRLLKPGHPIPIALKPGGRPAAQLVLGEATLVDMLGERAGFSKIAFGLSTLIVFGWVEAAELHPPEEGVGYGSGHGRPAIQDPPQTVLLRLRCPDELTLVGQVREQRRTVGLIRRNTTVLVLDRLDEETQVWVHAKGIHPLPEGSLRVRTEALAHCQPVAAAGGVPSDSAGSTRSQAE